MYAEQICCMFHQPLEKDLWVAGKLRTYIIIFCHFDHSYCFFQFAGFGINETTSKTPQNQLIHASVLYVNQTQCAITYSLDEDPFTAISVQEKIMICAIGADGQDACTGDSGGPLYDREAGVLVGIVSFGWGCGNVNFPGIYTRISSMVRLILRFQAKVTY